MDRKDKNGILLIIFLILGLVMAVQFRSTMLVNKQKAASAVDAENLKKQLVEEINIGKTLKEQINALENKKNESIKADVNNTGNTYLRQQKQYLDYVKLIAGLTDVKGPGVVIKMNDAAMVNSGIQDANYFIIHDSDILKIINELKKAGAQAISVNEERIMSISEQVCAGPTIRINKNRHPVPFEIKAIGDPDQLYKAVDKSDRMEVLRSLKIRVEMSKVKEVTIPKYNNKEENLITGLEVINK